MKEIIDFMKGYRKGGVVATLLREVSENKNENKALIIEIRSGKM